MTNVFPQDYEKKNHVPRPAKPPEPPPEKKK